MFPGLATTEEPAQKTKCLTDIIGEIKKLESNRDPKCHATATRLENFIYGTKVSHDARFLKVKLQKKMILALWTGISKAYRQAEANKTGQKPLASLFKEAISKNFPYSRVHNGDFKVKLQTGKPLVLEKRDWEHYSSVAYALRTILAVQQEALLQPGFQLVPLGSDSIAVLKEFLDVVTLAALQRADHGARLADKYEIGANLFQSAWDTVAPREFNKQDRQTVNASTPRSAPPALNAKLPPSQKFPTIHRIIEQKVKSYEAYNKISMPVFLRNLQVYFARHRWPKDKNEGVNFRNLFTEFMVDFASRSWKYAEKRALKAKRRFIREEDVHHMWAGFVPFHVNEYEDIIFFPKLGHSQRITIESYDTDSFRDSGIHWKYLQYAMQDHGPVLKLEPDPFAAELLVEGISQYGVLLLRVAGKKAKEAGHEELKTSHLTAALKDINTRIANHRAIPPDAWDKKKTILASSGQETKLSKSKTYFTDITARSGIRFDHRSSDWLSRLLRTYLKKSPTVGNLTIPPAFGGSGAASGDINNDNIPDVLLLSGTGNKLYLGDGKGGFKDITAAAGVDFRRPGGLPGEPRQPVIADFDNDGLQDIFISYVNDRHRLYRNTGNLRFEDVTANAGLGGENTVAGPALAFDFDNDGLLDIYIGYFGDYLKSILPTLKRENLNGLPNKLFKNTGNMRFKDVTPGSGTAHTGWTQALAHTDLDRDGRQDIIVGNDFGVNAYLRNKGDGTFENVAPMLEANKPSFTMNVGITDLNRDRFPDIYISNIVMMVKDEKYVLPGADTTMKFNPEKLGRMRIKEANDLFISGVENGKLIKYSLSDAVGRGYSSTGWSWDADFFDFDNDGDDDLYCVNGMNEYAVYSSSPYYSDTGKGKEKIQMMVYEKESNVFFVNQGGKLQNFSKASGTDFLGNSRSTVYLDFDGDGDLDIVLNNYHGPAVVYRNNSEELDNNWLKIKLVGDPTQKTNRDAIGATITVTKNNRQLAWREIRGGHGYLSQDPKIQHVGLGKEGTVDLEVTWPNGKTSRHQNVKANQLITLNQKSL